MGDAIRYHVGPGCVGSAPLFVGTYGRGGVSGEIPSGCGSSMMGRYDWELIK